MAKKIKTIVKVQIVGGQANPAPPVGTALGPHGVNIGDFTKQFNDQTRDQMGTVLPCEITIYEDRSFSFKVKTPPAAFLLKQAAKVEKGSGTAWKAKVGSITRKQAEDIATLKMSDLSAYDLGKAVKIIEGSARSMGIEVK